MKMECLIANVTAVRSPAKTEFEIFLVIIDVFWQIQAVLVFVNWNTPFRPKNLTYLGSFN